MHNFSILSQPGSVSRRSLKMRFCRGPFLAIAFVLLSALEPLALLAQGTAFTYQGQLNNNGSPANGSFDLQFTLFNTGTGGSSVAGPLTNSATAVINGLLTV